MGTLRGVLRDCVGNHVDDPSRLPFLDAQAYLIAFVDELDRVWAVHGVGHAWRNAAKRQHVGIGIPRSPRSFCCRRKFERRSRLHELVKAPDAKERSP